MKAMNLSSYADAFNTLKQDEIKKYLDYFGVQVKAKEGEDIFTFVKQVMTNGVVSDELSNFFVGYSIPQISKEFDLLRFGDNYNLDIELKNISTEEKIATQLKQNGYYLKALGTPVQLYAYVIQTEEVYTLDQNDNLITTTLKDLVAAIEGQKHKSITDIDTLFKPSVYLVSPLNSTEKFISGSYFLNGNQLSAKNEIIKSFNQGTLPFAAIEGKPGTGKTLLTYDIANQFMDLGWNVCIFHCGILAEGHLTLRKKHSWTIHRIKDLASVLEKKEKYDLIVVDETQRIYNDQLEIIINYVRQNQVKCIFSYDPDQVFTTKELLNKSIEKIEQLNHKKYKLTQKIRTNKEIAAFITNLFNINKMNSNMDYKNIHLQYFDSARSLRCYLEQLKENSWEVIDYTSSNYYSLSIDKYSLGNRNAHRVIGQEFDKVAVVINELFYYNDSGQLLSTREAGSPGYRMDKMLYQILTRARQEITIVIYKNKDMLNACLKIMGL
ncbi:hypothetical protein ABE82_26855 (plasmid) [Paenibacillus peoriae]|uniref:DNA/RNA helicase domain-containing protein n=1 Tax=Paenibacillus peoriae TaxID=59893 RepID=UPI00072065EC|nr:DNA/RNA helicase domain-containing protein [Paenibacillus peoriae]ALS10029.1 hypothetical protein ABE82_26855 [Paenibacillus peoriae]